MITNNMLKKGYKHTEIGVIPTDWDVATLDEVGTFSKGQGVRKDEALSGDYPCVRYGELYTRHDNYIKEFHSFISEEVAKNAKKLKKGDILFAGSGETKEEIGKAVAFIGETEAYAGGDIVILSPKNVDSLFLGYLLNAPIIVRQKASRGQGDAVVHITGKNLKEVQIPLPSDKEEQAGIAKALMEVEMLVELFSDLIKKKRNIKRGAMRKLLNENYRLPGFKNKWKNKKIEEFADTTSGGTPSTSVAEYWGGSIKWMSSGELNLKLVNDVKGRITKKGLESSSAKLLPKNSVLIGLAGQGKTRGTVALNTVELCTNQSIAAVLPNKSFVPEYLFYNLEARYEELRALSTGDGGRGGLNLTIIRRLQIPFPSFKEQEAIALIIGDMDVELRKLESIVKKYEYLKDAMTQQLLTGNIRLV